MDRAAVPAVAAGGFAGALARHAVAVAFPTTFPWGTLAVNGAGAFLLGLVVYGRATRARLSDAARLFVATGFLSSFTTYSTFASEVLALPSPLAAAYVAVTYGVGFAAALLAREVIRWRS